jgi:hypothetical protein
MSDIKMIGPDNCAPTVSWNGQDFAANKKGVFTVPVEAYADLLQHDFVAIGDVADAAVEAQP